MPTPTSTPTVACVRAVDLRPDWERWRLPLKSQGARGTCSVFAITAAIEHAVARRTGKGVRLSEEFLNAAANRADGSREDGGFFHDLWRGYERYGICEERYLPYAERFDPDLRIPRAAWANARAGRVRGLRLHWIKAWDVTTGLEPAQIVAIHAALQRGVPVLAGMRWPREPEWDGGLLRMCGPEHVFDGHSVLIVGYEPRGSAPGGGAFLVRDSGGGGRWRAIPVDFAAAYINDAAWVE